MKLLNTCNRVVETLSKIGAVGGGVGIIILMLIATAGAIGRKLGHPVPDTMESCQTIMFSSVFLGMAYVALQRGHINVTIFTQRLPARVQDLLDAFVLLLAATIFGVLTYASWGLAWKWFLIREVMLGAFPWPVWPFRFLFVFGIGLITLQLIFSALLLITKALGREE